MVVIRCPTICTCDLIAGESLGGEYRGDDGGDIIVIVAEMMMSMTGAQSMKYGESHARDCADSIDGTHCSFTVHLFVCRVKNKKQRLQKASACLNKVKTRPRCCGNLTCPECNMCVAGACDCHEEFQRRFRFDTQGMSDGSVAIWWLFRTRNVVTFIAEKFPLLVFLFVYGAPLPGVYALSSSVPFDIILLEFRGI